MAEADIQPGLPASSVGGGRVSGNAREAVRKAVLELGYVPNPSARALVTAQGGTVLTTVHQPVQALGREMAKMLIDLMAGEQPSPLLLPTHLVVRASAP